MAQQLTYETAEELIRRMTDGLVNIVDETGQFLLPLADGTLVDTKGWKGWEWTHGVALTALAHHSAIHPSSEAALYSQRTALDWFELQYKLTNGKGAPKNINTMSPFYCLAELLTDGRTKDKRWLQWCDEWAEWVMHDLPKTQEGGFQHMTYIALHENHLWDDTLMMTVIPLARIGILLDRPHYVKEALYQFLLHIQYLQDPYTGLWYHGWQFGPEQPQSTGHNFAKALWARGNCWITTAIPMLLEIIGEEKLPKDDPIRRTLVQTWRRQVDALIPLQDAETGLWHTLLVDKTSYVETSASAGFVAGILAGLRMGLITGDTTTYTQIAQSALQGVIAQVQPDGEVANVSFGTGMGDSFQFYKDIPITPMPYGQALVMLALVEWERLNGMK